MKIPTIGFNVEAVSYKNLTMNIWDIGGQEKIRKLWSYYFNNCDALIYVVDSSDIDRIEEASEEFWKVANHDEMIGKPTLIFANKQDRPISMYVNQIIEKFGLMNCRSRQWLVQGTCATSGDGIYEGLEWLSNNCFK